MDALVEAITRFGYRMAPSSADENWVVSPTSIAIALGMVRAGSGGATAAEIDKTLGFPPAVHDAFNALTRLLITDDVPPAAKANARQNEPTRAPGSPPGPTTVCIGDALFPAKGFDIKQAFLRTLAEQYGTGVYPVDFHQTASKQAIDAWAQRQTADRIQKVFDQIDPDTALVLANTVYFKGDWRTVFEKSSSADADFHRANGSTVRVPTMHAQLGVGYAEGDGWQAVDLPYGDGTFAMRILLPTGSRAPGELLAPEVLSAVGSSLKSQPVDVMLPRWDFAADIALRDELVRLGVASMFDRERADLSGMSPVPLYVAQAVHRATITVDEFGTEAAAVTAFAAAPSSARPSATVALHADHPFAFAIMHLPTGTPLFVGQVADPSAH